MVKKIIVKKILTDEETELMKGQKLPKGYFKTIIRENVDVYTEDGIPLLRFRKKALPQKNVQDAYDNLIEHAKKVSRQRGVCAGAHRKDKKKGESNIIRSNIVGYFDNLTLMQKYLIKKNNLKKVNCRQTAFTANFPEKWQKVIPLIQDIGKQYKKLFPKQYAYQYRKAHQTVYVIKGTPFSTVTTNLNVQTAAHTDKGNLEKSFGNLVVIGKGNYKGGYTGYPQYGVAVDVQTGDFLAMNIHLLHGNTPIEGKPGEFERMSLVSYLREGIVNKCKDDKRILPANYFGEKGRKITPKPGRKRKTAKKSKKGKKNKTAKKGKGKKKTSKKKKIFGIF